MISALYKFYFHIYFKFKKIPLQHLLSIAVMQTNALIEQRIEGPTQWQSLLQ